MPASERAKWDPMSFVVTESDHHNWNGGYREIHGYLARLAPEHPRADPLGYVREHILVAETALGKPLPGDAQVHHVNGIKGDNRSENLVVCEDDAYHSLLHQRQRALEVCGNADWRLCPFCGEYDAPGNMYVSPRSRSGARHRECFNEYRRKRAAKEGWDAVR